ncbi:MAG: DNA polymerase III subunit alpha [bacterium]
MSTFVHLHNHTHYSLLDGACRIEDLVHSAKQFKMPAIAITDHGNMFGAIHFYQKVLKAGLKPIIGMEAYIAPKSRLEKSGGKGGKDTAYHLILLARNLDGYKNLMHLSSIGYLEGFYYKPRIDKEVLEAHAEGLIVLSGCIKGEISSLILHGDMKGAHKAAGFYKDLFGEHFYLEVQNHGIAEEETAMKGLLELSKTMDIPVVATNDTHYLKREDAQAQDVLLCIQTNKDLDDPQRLRFSTDQIYFKSPEEMADAFKETPDVLKTSLEIAEKCHVVLDFDTLHLPHFTVPDGEGVYSLDEYLEKKAWKGLKERFAEPTPDLEKRLTYELSVIKRMGYAGYFLIVMDFIRHAKSRNIPVGPGRGSAAGSLVSYAIGITDVDPIQYGLLFERFLNPERVSMPDIDIDFCYEQRDAIIDYVKQKYGEKNVTQIITFGSMNARAVIRDVGRVLKIPYGDVDRIAKLIPFQIGMTLDVAYKKVTEFRELCDQDETHRKLLDHARVLEGIARHASTHAAGVVIAPGELTQYVPIFKSSSGDVTTQYDMKSVESIGLLKMDFLGLRTLTVINHTIQALKKNGVEIDIHHIPYDDEETYRIFSRGETVGVFQFESSGMREYLKKLQPESIEDLTAMNALYRPGPMEWIDDFISRKRGRTKVEYLHPLLEPVLEETHGIIVYQEQVIQIASALGGFSMGKADLLRRAMGKKRPDLMQEQRNAFVEGAKSKGIPGEMANSIFDLMDRFAGYGFNKSHATGYSIVAFQTAFLKAHYPKEFMAANLTSEMGNTDRVVILIEECRRMGIEVFPPDVNESQADFTVTGEGLRFGLGAVKNVGKGAIQSIVEARDKEGKFGTIYDFCLRVNLRLVNKKVVESLIQVGAMDTLEGTRAQKMAAVTKSLSMAQAVQQNADRGQTTIFGEDVSEAELYPDLPQIDAWSQADKLRREKELLGFYVSGHPLLKYKDDVDAFAMPKLEHIDEMSTGQTVRICGIITEVKNLFDRKDKPMAFFTVEDFSGIGRVIAFSDFYGKNKDMIEKDRMVIVSGTVDRRNDKDEVSILASKIHPLEQARDHFAKRLSMNIESAKLTDEEMDRVKMLLEKMRGSCPIYLNIKSTGGDEFLLKSKKYAVRPTFELLNDLRLVLGNENVWIEG